MSHPEFRIIRIGHHCLAMSLRCQPRRSSPGTAGRREMRLKLALATALAAAATIATGMTIAPAASAADGTTTSSFTDIPVTGSIPSIEGTFTGTVDIESLALQDGKLVANEALTGKLLDSGGDAVETVADQPITQTVTTEDSGGCQILDLTLGALDLNVLGLVVHLDPINLEITGETGSGNLLGSLLCMVADLLNGSSSTGLLQPLIDLLNQILGGLCKLN